MATTPPEKKAPPPATPGFAAALFGGLFSTAKKQRLVDSSTVPMASVARTTRVHHRPEIYLESENESTSIDKVVTTSAIDLLDTDVPSASPEPQMESSTSFPVKSPWKSPSLHAMNGSKTSSLRFSVGNVKAPPSERRSSLSQKSQITNRRRYTPSALLVPSRRGKTGPINAVNAVNALQNSQNLFQLSSKQAEARNNHISFRVGKRLLGSSQSGGSRLAQAVDMEERSPSSEERAVKRRKHVMFGDAVDATPIESEVVTPTRTPGQKRKGTPFKATISEVDTTPHHAEAPTPSRKPSIGPRPQTKILLEKGNYNFEESGETKPLGSPVASRTPLFMQNPSMTLQLPLDHAPRTAAKRFKDQAATPSVKETSKPAAIDTFRPGGAAKTRAATFKCHECQAETSIEQSKCSKCGAARQVVTSGWGDLFADQKKRWKCAVCSVQNEQSATECAACETPRDGKESTAPSSSKDAPVSKASIGTSGFSFGGGSAVPATSTGGFTFGSQSAPPKSLPSKEAGFSLASATSSSSKGQGFTFGAAPTSTTTGTSFTFGTSTTSATSGTASSGGGFKFDTPAPGGSSGGGFSFSSFPASATEKEKSRTSTGNGTSASTLVPASPSAPSSNESSSKSLAENETKTPSFKFGSTASSKAETENHKPAGFSFASSAQATGEGNGVAKPFQFNASSDEKKSEDALTVKPNFSFHSSSSSSPKKPQLPIPGTEPADKAGPANGSSLTFPMSNINKSDLNVESANKPVFSFGSSGGTATNSSTGFSFGGRPAPAAPTTAATFNFSAPSALSTDTGVVPLGSMINRDDTDDDRSKRRRERENDVASSGPTFGGPTTASQVTTPAFTFGSSAPAPTTFGSQPQSDAHAIGFGASIPPNTAGGFSFGAAPAPTASSTFKFGDSSNASAPTFASDSISTEKASAPLFGQSTPSTAPSFGSSQALVPSFGSAAPAPASTSNPFSSTATASSFSFSSGPAPAPSFGSTTVPAPSFGSTSAPVPSFGSTSAPAPSFGSTSVPAPSFGSTPAQAPAPMFGSTPAPAPMFGSTPGTSLPQFGSAPTPSGPGFGVAPPAPQIFGSTIAAPFGSTPAEASFGSAAPSSSSFGSAPSSFGAAPAPFGSVAGSFGGATPGQPSFGFGGAESGPGGFVSPAGGFGNQGGFSTPGAESVQFSIGTGGSTKSAMRGRRPLLRAKRPTSGR